jgi:hypothetical protein
MERSPVDGPAAIPPTQSRDWRPIVALVLVALIAPLVVATFVAPKYIRHSLGEPIPVDDRWNRPQEFVTRSGVYLVPVVRLETVDIEELTVELSKRFGVRVEGRPGIQLESTAVDMVRNELIADRVLRALRRSYTVSTPIGGGQWPVVIGLTDFELHPTADTKTRYSSTAQDRENGYAIVSTAGLQPDLVERVLFRVTLEERVRRLVAWNLAVLYLDLPDDTDPDDVRRQDRSLTEPQ